MGRGLVLQKESISSKKTYKKYYRDKENPPVPKGLTIKDYNEYSIMMGNIGRAIAHGITETHGGVRIRGLGYFTVAMMPVKRVNRDNFIGGRFIHTDSNFMMYRATFVPERVNHPIKDFVIENSMFRTVKQRIKVQIKYNKFKYRTYLHTFMKAKRHQNVKRW